MRYSWAEIIAGALVLLFAGAFFVFAAGVANFGQDSGGYVLNAKFNSVEGVTLGDDVRLGGVSVGEVINIELNQELYIIEMEVRLRDDIAVPIDSEIKIASKGLLGGSFVEIVAGGDSRALEDGDSFTLATSATDLLSLFTNFVSRGNE